MNPGDIGIRLTEAYARALFDLARESQLVDAVKDDLDLLMDVAAEERDFARVMTSPYFSEQVKMQLVRKIFCGRISKLTVNFLMVVIAHDRMTFLPKIATRYDEIWDGFHGRYIVNVTVSQTLTDDEVRGLSDDIAAAIKSQIRLDLAVNPGIIGGIVIRCGDRVIDNSIKGRLQRAVETIAARAKRGMEIDEV
jgi:F-type H+-transporting ATPase subunit delta